MTKSASSNSGKGAGGAGSNTRAGQLAPRSGQAARTAALREARTAQVKAALTKAGSSSSLFKRK